MALLSGTPTIHLTIAYGQKQGAIKEASKLPSSQIHIMQLQKGNQSTMEYKRQDELT